MTFSWTFSLTVTLAYIYILYSFFYDSDSLCTKTYPMCEHSTNIYFVWTSFLYFFLQFLLITEWLISDVNIVLQCEGKLSIAKIILWHCNQKSNKIKLLICVLFIQSIYNGICSHEVWVLPNELWIWIVSILFIYYFIEATAMLHVTYLGEENNKNHWLFNWLLEITCKNYLNVHRLTMFLKFWSCSSI